MLPGLMLATGLALLEARAGITLAFYTDWPSSFWITVLAAVLYLGATLSRRRVAQRSS